MNFLDPKILYKILKKEGWGNLQNLVVFYIICSYIYIYFFYILGTFMRKFNQSHRPSKLGGS